MNDGIAAALHGTRVGSVEAIHVATGTGGDPAPRDCVTAVADRGIEGDRYFAGDGIYNDREDLDPSDVTLIEAEALAAAAADYDVDLRGGAHRRNITTRGVALNHLVGHRFRVGGATLEGTGLCEPCGYMESLADQPDAERALVHRGGLDARIVDSGAIETGDDVVW
jgi:MOSC domain-containing protein YiiM